MGSVLQRPSPASKGHELTPCGRTLWDPRGRILQPEIAEFKMQNHIPVVTTYMIATNRGVRPMCRIKISGQRAGPAFWGLDEVFAGGGAPDWDLPKSHSSNNHTRQPHHLPYVWQPPLPGPNRAGGSLDPLGRQESWDSQPAIRDTRT